jgi:TatD DNase family protein
MLVDSHCHLDFPDFDADRDDVIARARAAGVGTIVTISTRVAKFSRLKEIAARYDDVWCSIGTHPHNAAEEPDVTAEQLAEIATSEPLVVAIGEAGLDYHYDNSPRSLQREAFAAQLALAGELDLPVVIHTREAEADTIRLLDEHRPPRGVVHCFTGSAELAERALDLGLMISFSGILTFAQASPLREIALAIPGDRLLVETDAPYLAPIPNRGRRNEPAWVLDTLRVLAEARGETPEGLAAETTANFERLFGVVF